MKTMMLLLVSAVAVLVGPAVAGPTRHQPEENLNRIIDLAEKYNQSLTKEFFVEDVLNLVEDGCEDTFFCKVYTILHGHEHFGKRKEEKELVRNLKMFTDSRSTNCTVLLKDVTATGISRPIPDLVQHLITCIKRRNYNP